MTTPRIHSRWGISLVEIMVAVTLLGILVTAHTLVTMKYAIQTRNVGAGVARAAALSAAIDLFSTRPFDLLSSSQGCTTITTIESLVHDRCVQYTKVSDDLVKLVISIRPRDATISAVTVTLYRSSLVPESLFI